MSMRGRAAPVVLLLALLAGTLAASAALRKLDRDHVDAVRAERAEVAKAAVRGAFTDPLDRLRQLAAALEVNARPLPEDFAHMARPLLENPAIQAASLVEPVGARERPAFERETGIAIVDPIDGRPAPARPIHYVVAGVAARTEVPLGIDLAASPQRLTVLEQAGVTGKVALTEPVAALDAGSEADELAMIAFEPVMGRRFVSVALNDAKLAAAIEAALPPRTSIEVRDGERVVARAGNDRGGTATSFTAGERTFTLRTHVSAPAPSPWPAMVLGLGVLLSVLAATTLAIARRGERDRTAERDAERGFSASVLAAMPDGLIVKNDDTLLTVNDALCELSGYSREELEGHRVPSPLWPPESLPAIAATTAAADRDGRAEAETVLRRKDGTLVEVLLGACAVRDRNGERLRVGVVKDISARVAAERALAASELRLRELADASAEVVARLSTDECIEWISPSARAVLGQEPEALVGRRFGELFADSPAGAGAIRRRGGIRRILRPDGTEILTETTLAPMRDGDGALTGIRIALSDVTERESARRALAQSESRYRALVANLPDATVVLVDRDGRFVLAQGGALDSAGWEPAQLLGRRYDELGRGAVWEPVRRAWADALEGVPAEMAHTAADGRRHFLTRFVPIRDAGGEIDGAMCVAIDVTVVREREDAARRADARFRAMFEHAPTGIGMIDASGRIIEANDTWTKMLSADAADLIGRPLTDFVHPEHHATVERIAALAAEGETEATVELRLQVGKGREAWALISACRLPDAADAHPRVLCQVQEISASKSLEFELRVAADHDPLTGALNRRGFEARARERMNEDLRHGGTSAVLMGDLDGFKAVNDALGHAAGDELLRTVFAALASTLREEDLLARLGGDEFAILVPHGGEVDLDVLARRVQDALAATAPDGHTVSASIGIATLSPDRTLESALEAADAALYAVKAAGRASHQHAAR